MYEVAKELERRNLGWEIPCDYDRLEQLECWSERDFEDVLLPLGSITADDYEVVAQYTDCYWQGWASARV